MSDNHYVEIETAGCTYRFYGLGVWKVKIPNSDWTSVNAIYIPVNVLRIAARYSMVKLNG